MVKNILFLESTPDPSVRRHSIPLPAHPHHSDHGLMIVFPPCREPLNLLAGSKSAAIFRESQQQWQAVLQAGGLAGSKLSNCW